jgi:hypothetical protein
MPSPFPTVEQVKEAYRRHYQSTKDTTSAWNNTLEELAGPYDPDASDEAHAIRMKISGLLMKLSHELNYELGDPYEVAVHTAVEALRQDRVAEIASEEFSKVVGGIKARIREERAVFRGPKEWSPRRKSAEQVEGEVEEAFERETEGHDFPALFIMFDDKGGLEGWQIEWPDYWRGHSGPTAQVFMNENVDYDDIRHAISEAFESIDWDEVQKELDKDAEE